MLPDVRAIFDAQAANRWAVAQRTTKERVRRLMHLREVIRARRADLCAAVLADYGKHPVETELTELVPVMEELGLAIRRLHQWTRPRRVSTPLTLLGTHSVVRYEPKGLVLVLAPWNYPFQLAMTPLIAAVAAGNCVVVRPSGKTPRTSRVLQELVSTVFPENEAAVVLGDRTVADALLDLPFDHILFTGSTAVGRKVMAAAAKHLAPVTLELGGQSPAIVDETADVETAGERIAWGKFTNAGQTCVAPDYALVQEVIAERFSAAVVGALCRFYGADEAARLASPDLARLVDQAACSRLDRAVRATVEAGARLVVGGSIDASRRRMSPTVLTGVAADSAIMAEEIFGPVLPVLTFHAIEDAVAAVRARPKPLALYVFSRSRTNTAALVGGTSAGGTCINQVLVHLANPHLPFGGVGDSGMGHYHGRYGFEAMSHARAVLTQRRFSPLRYLFPPFTARSTRLVALLRRIVG
jgi:aldehyde dehydrogenase (NAD+)